MPTELDLRDDDELFVVSLMLSSGVLDEIFFFMIFFTQLNITHQEQNNE